jgi:hypothetical protein
MAVVTRTRARQHYDCYGEDLPIGLRIGGQIGAARMVQVCQLCIGPRDVCATSDDQRDSSERSIGPKKELFDYGSPPPKISLATGALGVIWGPQACWSALAIVRRAPYDMKVEGCARRCRWTR